MRTLALISFGALSLAAVACSPAATTSSTTVTSAEVASPESSSKLEFPGEVPAGQLVCRAQSIHVGKVELYLDWKNGTAAGTLRQIGSSGHITEQKVHAERIKGSIVADEDHAADLVVHAAMVREWKGHPYIRLGDWRQGWTRCD